MKLAPVVAAILFSLPAILHAQEPPATPPGKDGKGKTDSTTPSATPAKDAGDDKTASKDKGPDKKKTFFIDLFLGAERVEVKAQNEEASDQLSSLGVDEKVKTLAFLDMVFTQYFNEGEFFDRIRFGLDIRLTNLALQGNTNSSEDPKETALEKFDVLNALHTLRFEGDFYLPLTMISKPTFTFEKVGAGVGLEVDAGFSTDRTGDVKNFEYIGARLCQDHLTYVDVMVGHQEEYPHAMMMIRGEVVLLNLSSDARFIFGGRGILGRGNDNVAIFFGISIGADALLKSIPGLGSMFKEGK